ASAAMAARESHSLAGNHMRSFIRSSTSFHAAALIVAGSGTVWHPLQRRNPGTSSYRAAVTWRRGMPGRRGDDPRDGGAGSCRWPRLVPQGASTPAERVVSADSTMIAVLTVFAM